MTELSTTLFLTILFFGLLIYMGYIIFRHMQRVREQSSRLNLMEPEFSRLDFVYTGEIAKGNEKKQETWKSFELERVINKRKNIGKLIWKHLDSVKSIGKSPPKPFCPVCGFDLSNSSIFCTLCGSNFK